MKYKRWKGETENETLMKDASLKFGREIGGGNIYFNGMDTV